MYGLAFDIGNEPAAATPGEHQIREPSTIRNPIGLAFLALYRLMADAAAIVTPPPLPPICRPPAAILIVPFETVPTPTSVSSRLTLSSPRERYRSTLST